MMMIAIIHPISEFTRPRPPPRISTSWSPAQVTRLAYEKPVVARNKAEDEAIIALMFVYCLINKSTTTLWAY